MSLEEVVTFLIAWRRRTDPFTWYKGRQFHHLVVQVQGVLAGGVVRPHIKAQRLGHNAEPRRLSVNVASSLAIIHDAAQNVLTVRPRDTCLVSTGDVLITRRNSVVLPAPPLLLTRLTLSRFVT